MTDEESTWVTTAQAGAVRRAYSERRPMWLNAWGRVELVFIRACPAESIFLGTSVKVEPVAAQRALQPRPYACDVHQLSPASDAEIAHALLTADEEPG